MPRIDCRHDRPENQWRRVVLTTGAAAVLLASTPLRADEDETIRRINELTNGSEPITDAGIHLDVPELVNDGNKIPLRVTVDSPMTADDHIRRIIVLAEENPRPEVAVFLLSKSIPKAEIATRIRLSHSQHVIVLAEYSDGHFGRTEAVVTVVNGGCS